MKRTIGTLAVSVGLAVTIAGASWVGLASQVAGEGVRSNGAAVPAAPTQASGLADPDDQLAAAIPAQQAPKRNIVMTVDSDASLKYYFDEVGDMAAAPVTTAILRGVVTAVQDYYSDNNAYRVLTIAVSESRKHRAAKSVTVYEDGGYVPYAAILPELQVHSETKLPAAGPDDYVDFRFMGSPHTEVGDRIVAFVRPNPNSWDLLPADYQLVSSVQSLLVKDRASGEYERHGVARESSQRVERELSSQELSSTLTESAGAPIKVAE